MDRSPRDRILDTAAELFYREGYRAVGIDTLIAASGVAKMTLYRHFASKDALVAASLSRADERFWLWAEAVMAPYEGRPAEQLGALFDAVAARASSPECLGCAFVGAAAEFPDPAHPGHEQALAHKQKVLSRLLELSLKARADDPQALAAGLLLLMDGAWSAARVFGPGGHANHVGAVARRLLAAHTRQSG